MITKPISVTLDYQRAFRAMRKNSDYVPTVTTVVARNTNVIMEPMGLVGRSISMAEIWSQAVDSVLVRLAGIWLQSP
jgi:hypothetical protein